MPYDKGSASCSPSALVRPLLLLSLASSARVARTYLEKEPQLQPGEMLQVVIGLEPLVQMAHTRWKVFAGDVIDHFCRDD